MSVFHDAPKLGENELAFAVADKYPASLGHILVCPKREVASWFDVTPEEQEAILQLVALMRRNGSHNGYRILINTDGAQHIPHVHVHLIPHYSDSPERWV